MTQWAVRRPSIGLERAKSLIATDCQESLCVFTQRWRNRLVEGGRRPQSLGFAFFLALASPISRSYSSAAFERYSLISGSTSLARLRSDSCQPR